MADQTSNEQDSTAKREGELIRRYRAGLPLTKSDRREARRILAERTEH